MSQPPEDDYAAKGRPAFQGPLGFRDAADAVQAAAEQGKRTAARAEVLIDLAIEMLTAFRQKFLWFFPVKK
jgi:hypothetical protein